MAADTASLRLLGPWHRAALRRRHNDDEHLCRRHRSLPAGLQTYTIGEGNPSTPSDRRRQLRLPSPVSRPDSRCDFRCQRIIGVLQDLPNESGKILPGFGCAAQQHEDLLIGNAGDCFDNFPGRLLAERIQQ